MVTAAKRARLASAASASRWSTHRAFFTGLSLAMVVAVFVGFSRSYYLKSHYGTPELPALFHVHGLLFTTWMLFLVVQTGLVAARRTPLHRRLGVAGGVLAAAMTVAAMAMTMDLARRSAAAPTDEGLAFTIVPFASVIVFPVLVGFALLYRRQPEVHKRLMLIATGNQRQTRNKNATRGDPEEAADRARDEADRGYGKYIFDAAVNHGERGA